MNPLRYTSSSVSQKKTLRSQEAEEKGNTIREFSMGPSSSSSLKGKFHQLHEAIQQVADELKAHRQEATSLKDQKENIKSLIINKSDLVKKRMKEEIEKVEKEMERHFSHQKAENSRLQQQISQLKTEKAVVQNQILALQRRIADIDLQIGENA